MARFVTTLNLLFVCNVILLCFTVIDDLNSHFDISCYVDYHKSVGFDNDVNK